MKVIGVTETKITYPSGSGKWSYIQGESYVRQPKGRFSIKSYGAKSGDSSFNNKNAITKAILDAALTSTKTNKNTVYIPEGTYNVEPEGTLHVLFWKKENGEWGYQDETETYYLRNDKLDRTNEFGDLSTSSVYPNQQIGDRGINLDDNTHWILQSDPENLNGNELAWVLADDPLPSWYDTSGEKSGLWNVWDRDPRDVDGSDGEYWINRRKNNVWQKSGGAWSSIGPIIRGSGTGWTADYTKPYSDEGSDGDVHIQYWLEKDTGTVFEINQDTTNVILKGDGKTKSILSFSCWGNVDPKDYDVEQYKEAGDDIVTEDKVYLRDDGRGELKWFLTPSQGDIKTGISMTSTLAGNSASVIVHTSIPPSKLFGRYYYATKYNAMSRGHMFMVETKSRALFQSGVYVEGFHFKDLQIEGNTLYSGTDAWQTMADVLANWDTGHKGIIVGFDNDGPVRDIRIEDCIVRGFQGEIIYGGGGNYKEVYMANCDITESNGSAISVSGNFTMENCNVYHVYNGLENLCQDYGGQYAIIRDCHIYDIGKFGAVMFSEESGWYGSEDPLRPGNTFITIEDTIFEDCFHSGIYFDAFAQDVTIKNVDFIDCRQTGVLVSRATTYNGGALQFRDFIFENINIINRTTNTQIGIQQPQSGFPLGTWTFTNINFIPDTENGYHTVAGIWISSLNEDTQWYIYGADFNGVTTPIREEGITPVVFNLKNVGAVGLNLINYEDLDYSVNLMNPIYNIKGAPPTGSNSGWDFGDFSRYVNGFTVKFVATFSNGIITFPQTTWNNFPTTYTLTSGETITLKFNEIEQKFSAISKNGVSLQSVSDDYHVFLWGGQSNSQGYIGYGDWMGTGNPEIETTATPVGGVLDVTVPVDNNDRTYVQIYETDQLVNSNKQVPDWNIGTIELDAGETVALYAGLNDVEHTIKVWRFRNLPTDSSSFLKDLLSPTRRTGVWPFDPPGLDDPIPEIAEGTVYFYHMDDDTLYDAATYPYTNADMHVKSNLPDLNMPGQYWGRKGGPLHAFANKYIELTGKKVVFVCSGYGDSGIMPNETDYNGGNWRDTLRFEMKDKWDLAYNHLETNYTNNWVFKGIVWNQGEAENRYLRTKKYTVREVADELKTLFDLFVGDYDFYFNEEDDELIKMYQAGIYFSSDIGSSRFVPDRWDFELVREFQELAASEHPNARMTFKALKDFYFDDVKSWNDPYPNGNTVHWNQSHYNRVGTYIAEDIYNKGSSEPLPNAPTNLTATADGPWRIKLSWTHPTTFVGSYNYYNIYQRKVGDTEWINVMRYWREADSQLFYAFNSLYTWADYFWSEHNIQPNTDYEFRIGIENEYGETLTDIVQETSGTLVADIPATYKSVASINDEPFDTLWSALVAGGHTEGLKALYLMQSNVNSSDTTIYNVIRPTDNPAKYDFHENVENTPIGRGTDGFILSSDAEATTEEFGNVLPRSGPFTVMMNLELSAITGNVGFFSQSGNNSSEDGLGFATNYCNFFYNKNDTTNPDRPDTAVGIDLSWGAGGLEEFGYPITSDSGVISSGPNIIFGFQYDFDRLYWYTNSDQPISAYGGEQREWLGTIMDSASLKADGAWVKTSFLAVWNRGMTGTEYVTVRNIFNDNLIPDDTLSDSVLLTPAITWTTPIPDESAWYGFPEINEESPELIDGSSSPVVVAICDQGLKTSTTSYDVVGSTNIWDANSDVSDWDTSTATKTNHGNQCALWASYWNKINVAQKPLAIDVFDVQVGPADRTSSVNLNDLIDGMAWAAQNGYRIVSASFQFTSSQNWTNYLGPIYRNNDALLFAPTGQNPQEIDPASGTGIVYPALFTGDPDMAWAIAVGAIDDETLQMNSKWSSTLVPFLAFSGAPSYAPPQAAGLAAMLLYLDPTLTGADIFELIKLGCQQYSSIENYSQYGIINYAKSLEALKNS
jgi:hypothetical protein